MEDFYKPKIVYQELTQGSSFAIDTKGEFFVSNTAYLITGNDLEYLLLFLNSEIVEYAYKTFYATMLGQNGIRWLAQHIHNLPIPKRNVMDKEKDLNVAESFGLTNEEVDYIKNREL